MRLESLWRTFLIVSLACASASGLARAQDVQDARPSPAAVEPPPAAAAGLSEREALIEQGFVLRQQARDEEALACFRRAAELASEGRVLAQIAFAEQAMGRWGESHAHLKQALADAANPWIVEHRELLEQELAKIEGNVGRLDVRTNVAVASLTVDGKEVGTTPLSEPLVVTAGAVVVSARASGYLSTTRRVPVHAGALSRTELILVPEPSVQRVDGTSPPERIARRTEWLYVAGAGALVSAAALGPWLRGEKLVDGLEADCRTQGSCNERYPRESAKIERLDAATNWLLIGGLSTSALAAATYWLWPRTERRSVQPSALFTPRSFGLGARVTY